MKHTWNSTVTAGQAYVQSQGRDLNNSRWGVAMFHFRHLTKLAVLIALLSFMFPLKAYAYIDLGTGSYILQMLVASLLGALFAIKHYWAKIRAFFNDLMPGRKKHECRQDDDEK